MTSSESSGQEMVVIWQLSDDPDALHALQAMPGLSANVGGLMPATTGPPVGSPDWWDAIEANSGVASLVGVIDRVKPRAGAHGHFEALAADGSSFRGPCLGGSDRYWEGSRIELMRSFPPPGFVPSGRLDADGGLVTEIWVEPDDS